MGLHTSRLFVNYRANTRKKTSLKNTAFSDEAINFKGLLQRPTTNEGYYEILTLDDVRKIRQAIIDECSEVTQITAGIVPLLLNTERIRWNKDKFKESAFEDSILKELYISSKLPPCTENTLKISFSSDSPVQECPVCLCDGQLGSYNCDCNASCKDCWKGYITNRISSHGFSQCIPCMNCDKILDENSVLELIDNPLVKNRYLDNLVCNFVDKSSYLSWCEKCPRVIQTHFRVFIKMICKCGHDFCCLCNCEWHTPIKCSALHDWKKKCVDDAKTTQWMLAHTKACPACGVNIEKNKGCNQMTCKNRSCRFSFCWVCLGDWKTHSGANVYLCNRYVQTVAPKDTNRADLERFHHYTERYENHKLSLRLTEDLYGNVYTRMREWQDINNTSWTQVQFLGKAIESLLEARKCLMYTYAFAYQLDESNHSAIFEINQRDLEVAVESLSSYFELESNSHDAELQSKIIDTAAYCTARQNKLIDHVFEGYDKSFWKYRSNK